MCFLFLNQCWGAGAGSRDFLQVAGARAGKKIQGAVKHYLLGARA